MALRAQDSLEKLDSSLERSAGRVHHGYALSAAFDTGVDPSNLTLQPESGRLRRVHGHVSVASLNRRGPLLLELRFKGNRW